MKRSAERTAVGATRLVVAEIRVRHGASGRSAMSATTSDCFTTCERWSALAADHQVDRRGAVGIVRKVERLQRMIIRELLVEASVRIDADREP
jgi:hypothetical protein